MKKKLIFLYLISVPLLEASKASCHAFKDQHIASLPVPVKIEKKEKTQSKKTLGEKRHSDLEEPIFSISSLPRQEAISRSYMLLESTLTIPTTKVLDAECCKNLELLCGQKKKEKNLLQLLNKTHFADGEVFLATLLTHPVTNKNTLEARQAIIRTLAENDDLRNQLNQLFESIKKEHTAATSIYSQEYESTKMFIDREYWQQKSIKPLNTKINYQHIATNITLILFPLLAAMPLAVTNYIAAKSFYNHPQTITNLETILGYALVNACYGFTAYQTYNSTKKTIDTLNLLHEKTIGVARIVTTIDALEHKIATHKAFDQLEHRQAITNFAKNNPSLSKKMKRLLNLLRTNTFKGKPTIFALQGRVKTAYALLEEIKLELLPALLAIAEVDAYLSCATLFKENQNKSNHFCFATYLEQSAPCIKLKNMWNPFVGSDQSIVNSIELGDNNPQNIILTGPNAGGKSTFSKGLTLSIIMAQTIGIVPAQELSFTLFHKINTYMNINDDTAAGNSLFEAEVLRVEELLKTIKKLTPTEFSFSIMDEMFSGTSPKEGEALSYAVGKNIGKETNSLAVIASHFPKVKKLEEATSYFKNYQVRVIRDADGTFSYPFKLEVGAADQNVAIDILRKKGFESSILDDAKAILNQ